MCFRHINNENGIRQIYKRNDASVKNYCRVINSDMLVKQPIRERQKSSDELITMREVGNTYFYANQDNNKEYFYLKQDSMPL